MHYEEMMENLKQGFPIIHRALLIFNEKADHLIPLLDTVEDGKRVRTAGIIVDVIKRQTKTGKPFYNIILQTPREKQRITVWSNIYIQFKELLQINSLVKVRGKKGFGGLTAEDFEPSKHHQ